jgi:hypothetical protein
MCHSRGAAPSPSTEKGTEGVPDLPSPRSATPKCHQKVTVKGNSLKSAAGRQLPPAPMSAKRSRRKARPTVWRKLMDAAPPVWVVAIVAAVLALALIVGGVVVNVDRIDIGF